MHLVHVDVRVNPGAEQTFAAATRDNALNSRNEPGCLRFDVLQQSDDPTRFVLVEAYVDKSAALAHKETPHYLRWRDAVADLMAAPRTGREFVDLMAESE